MTAGAKRKRLPGWACGVPVAVLAFFCLVCAANCGRCAADEPDLHGRAPILLLNPPEQDFFSKQLDFHGIPIKAHAVVADEALYAACDRLSLLFANLLIKQPMVVSNLAAAGAALHIIGRDQVTTDLPEWRHDKHVPLDEYNGLTRDRRTRGMGGRLTSCGEENLLKLPNDRYQGRDICLHEFSHSILNNGCQRDIKALFSEQRRKSLDQGLWIGSYAGSNVDEFFAELTMWYFGARGDLSMTGPKPEPGPEGLKKYDPEAYALMDDFYGGRIEIARKEPRFRRRTEGPNGDATRRPRDSQVARDMVASLTAYKTGETSITRFFADAGMMEQGDDGKDGWHVLRPDRTGSTPGGGMSAERGGMEKFRVYYRDPSRNRDHSVADLEFKAGILTSFAWNN